MKPQLSSSYRGLLAPSFMRQSLLLLFLALVTMKSFICQGATPLSTYPRLKDDHVTLALDDALATVFS